MIFRPSPGSYLPYLARKASLPAGSLAAVDAGVSSAAARPRAPVGDKAARPFLELRDLAHAAFDVFAILFGLFFVGVFLLGLAAVIFAIWLAVI